MPKANVGDLLSIERVYPSEDFVKDATENDRPGGEVLRGVRVLSAPDDDGNFELEPATKHVGEAGHSTFLVPYRNAQPDPETGYRMFLRSIADAAKGDDYDPATSPGQGDPRIRGARQ